MIDERVPSDPHSRPLHATARQIAEACAKVAFPALLLLAVSNQHVVESLRPHEFGLAVLLLAAVVAGLAARSVAEHGSRYVILRVLIATAATAVALLAAEGTTRLVYRNVHSSGNARDYIARHGGGDIVHLNSLGFRDREIPPKNPDRFRIVVIGDSFTAGNGIAEQERFSNLIGEFLGPAYEV